MSGTGARPASYDLMFVLSGLSGIAGAAVIGLAFLQRDGDLGLVTLGAMALIGAALFAAAAGAIGLLGQIRDAVGARQSQPYDRLLPTKPQGEESTFAGRQAVRLGGGLLSVKTATGWAVFTDDAQAGRYFLDHA